LELTQELRQKLENHLFCLQIQLVGDLRQEHYEPRAQCPQCGQALTPLEILNGFNQDPNDFSTRCPRCQTRFEPRMISYSRAGSIELPFYCPVQVLDQLRGKELVAPKELSEHYSAIYRSAIIHFGTITRAFRQRGTEYLFPEIDSWKKKVQPFLGRLSDKAIAECVGASAKTIAQMRNKAGIKPFQWRKALKEANKQDD
jgi:hypothetical protein